MQIEQLSRQLDATEKQKASLAYVISLIIVIASLPLPIAGFLATLGYAKVQQKYSNFVRFHCWQAVLSQLVLLVFTSVFWGWSIQILMSSQEITNKYLYFAAFLIIFILIESVFAIVSAYQIEQGKHPKWWIIGNLLEDHFDDVEKI